MRDLSRWRGFVQGGRIALALIVWGLAPLDIWRKPVRSLVLPLSPEDIQQLPSDLRPLAGPEGPFKVPGWPLSKPSTSWMGDGRTTLVEA